MEMIKLNFQALGGKFQISLLPKQIFVNLDQLLLTKIQNEISKFLSEFELNNSEFIDQSFVSKINRHAGTDESEVNFETFELIKKSIYYSKLTSGHFDITFNTFMHPLKKLMSKYQLLEATAENIKAFEKELLPISNLKKNINFQNIYLKSNFLVKLQYPETKISLGGIGKGYAVDAIYHLLRSFGLCNFLINGNGDLRSHAHDLAVRPWHVAIKNPFAPEKNIGYLPLFSQAAASSGNYFQSYQFGPFYFGHIFSQNPNNDLSAVTILADECLHADVLATSVHCMGSEKGYDFCLKNHISAILIDNQGKVLTTHLNQRPVFSSPQKEIHDIF